LDRLRQTGNVWLTKRRDGVTNDDEELEKDWTKTQDLICKGGVTEVSKEPSVVSGCDAVLIPLPSFAFEGTLNKIKPYLKDGCVIGALPGQGAFDLFVRQVFTPEEIKERKLKFFGVQPQPFNCRITEYGRRVELIGTKTKCLVASVPGCDKELCDKDADRVMRELVGLEETFTLDNYLTLHLTFGNAGVHPARLYSLFHDYTNGSTYESNPLFYEEFDENTAKIVDKVATERFAIADKIGSAVSKQVMKDLDYLKKFYGKDILDYSNTMAMFRTNTLLKGLRCPITATGHVSQPKFMPDFTNRYFTEDVPYGLVFLKGIAELLQLETPTIDMLIKWSQQHLRMCYLDETEHSLMTDHDHIYKTCAPQRFDIDTLEKLKDFYNF